MHGAARIDELGTAFETSGAAREEHLTEDELRALGTVITLEGEGGAYPLKLDSLQQLTAHRTSPKQPKWLLLSVLPADTATDLPERATVWVSDQYRDKFLKIFEDYVSQTGPKGNPKNNELVANIARIRVTVLNDLWQSEGAPPKSVRTWWGIWLRPTDDGPDLLRRFAAGQGLQISPRLVRLFDRAVMWVEGSWAQLELLPFTSVPIAEIRSPEFVDTIEDLGLDPHHVVKKLLDHDSDTMTAHYARLTQQTVRRHWEAARKVSITGEITVESAGPLADAVWLKNSLSRAKMALPNGYCTLPLQQTCEYANACLTCPMFLTTAEFLPQHRQQLTETRALLEHAEKHDQQRVLQMNRAVERNLLTIITSLAQPADAAAAAAGGCCGGGEPSGCACRGQQGHSDAG